MTAGKKERMRIFLATHHRGHAHAYGHAINLVSRAALPGPGAHGPEEHATHAYVVMTAPGLAVRLDGDMPLARFRPWGPGFGVATMGLNMPLLWEVPEARKQEFAQRALALADNPPLYDPLEIGQALLGALGTLLENIPLPLIGSRGVRFVVSRATTREYVRKAMICSRLVETCIGEKMPTLLPETLSRYADGNGWQRFTPAQVL